jgi:Peptidase family C78
MGKSLQSEVIDLCSDDEDAKQPPRRKLDQYGHDNPRKGKRARWNDTSSSSAPSPSQVHPSTNLKASSSAATAHQPSPLLIFLDGEGTDSGDVTCGLMTALGNIPNILTCAATMGVVQSVMPHIQQRDKWSCGFRNLQMLLGSVVSVLPPTHSYFTGKGERYTLADGYLCLPSLVQIQSTLEQSWAEGYDPRGAEHYKGSIVGSRAQLGAVEVSSYLNFVGIDNVVVQFTACDESRLQLGPFCAAYFSKQHTASTCCLLCREDDDNSRSSIGSHDIARRLLKVAANSSCQPIAGPAQASCQCPMLPLYLQWKGHSVSIVGIEPQKGCYSTARHLLVFDPNTAGPILAGALDRGDTKPLRLSVASLGKKNCQIVLASTHSLCRAEQLERKLAVHSFTTAQDAVQRAL